MTMFVTDFYTSEQLECNWQLHPTESGEWRVVMSLTTRHYSFKVIAAGPDQLHDIGTRFIAAAQALSYPPEYETDDDE